MAKLIRGMRSTARHVAISALAATSAVTRRHRSGMLLPRVQVLLYHHVPPNLLPRFKTFLEGLAQTFRFIPYSEAVDRITTGRIDVPYLTISFDDGFKSCVAAARLMSELGAAACFFVNPTTIGLTDAKAVAAFNRDRLKGPPRDFMTWNDLDGLLKAGHEIGSHTMTHPNLASLSPSEVFGELADSRQILTARLGRVEHFAWPYGLFEHFSDVCARSVFEVGYRSCAAGVRGCHAASPASVRPCIHRDHVITAWPLHHARYFLARNALRALSPQMTWPKEWPAIPA